jgi:hypothetical protein
VKSKRLYDGRVTTPEEYLLIRAGHHLWRAMNSKKPSGWPIEALSAAVKTVWNAKEALRVELRQEYLDSRRELKNRLSAYRYTADQVKKAA